MLTNKISVHTVAVKSVDTLSNSMFFLYIYYLNTSFLQVMMDYHLSLLT